MKLETFDISAERIIKFNDILIDLNLDVPNTQCSIVLQFIIETSVLVHKP